jgi:co-chaperonin GroES (HSP10)
MTTNRAMTADDRRFAVTPQPELDLARIRLRGARVLIDKVRAPGFSQERKTASGIYLPAQSERVRSTYGLLARVIAVGPDIDPGDISPGDTVYIDEFGGRPLWWGGRAQPYWLAGEHEIMCVLRAETPADVAAIESGAALDVDAYIAPVDTPVTTYASDRTVRTRR